MKKIILGLAILLLLIGYTGWELASTDMAPSSNMWQEREAVQPPQTVSNGVDIMDDPLAAENGSSIPSALGVAELAPVEHHSKVVPRDAGAAPDAKFSASAEISTGANIYVFHGKTIVASKKPTESEKSRLQRAIELATATLPQPIVVLDADAESLSVVPFILFAEDRFDLTEAIKNSYLRLSDTSSTTEAITQSKQE